MKLAPAMLAALAGLSLALSACDEPKPRGEAPAEPAPGPGAARTSEPLPPLPAWAPEVMGKGLREAFTETGECVGNTDAVGARYEGAQPGVKIIGWGWDKAEKTAVERIVLVDADFRIVGAGETGLPRPDVTRAQPDITSPTTGWQAFTSRTAGPLDAYGVTSGGRGVCPLGHIEF